MYFESLGLPSTLVRFLSQHYVWIHKTEMFDKAKFADKQFSLYPLETNWLFAVLQFSLHYNNRIRISKTALELGDNQWFIQLQDE